MGFWSKLFGESEAQKAKKDAQKARKESEDRRIAELEQRVKDTREKAKKSLKEAIKKDLPNVIKNIQANQRESQEVRARFERYIKDPTSLDELSAAELEHLRLTTESEIEEAEEGIRQNEQIIASGPHIGNAQQYNLAYKEVIRKRRLLLKMIEGRKGRKPDAPPPGKSREDKRAEIQAELKRLETEKAKMVSDASNTEMKMKIANMYDDKQAQLLEDLRKLL